MTAPDTAAAIRLHRATDLACALYEVRATLALAWRVAEAGEDSGEGLDMEAAGDLSRTLRIAIVRLSDLASRLAAGPPGSVITIAYPGRILQPYSVQAWADLVVGKGRVRVVPPGHEAPTGSATTP